MQRPVRIIIALLAAAALSVSAPAGEDTLAPELENLFEIAGDEELLVSTVRGFDMLHQRLADWDIQLAREHFEKGDEALAEAAVERARRRMRLVRQAYEETLARYPRNGEVHNHYGELLYDRFNDVAGGLKHWERAIALDPKLAKPHNNLAIHLTHFGEYARGLEHMETALKLEPDNPDFLYNMVQFYLVHSFAVEEQKGWDREKVYKEAMRMSREAALNSEDDFDLWQDYAVNFFASERFGVNVDWADAADAWQRTRALARTRTERFFTLLNEGRAWLRGGEYEKARESLLAAQELEPDSGPIRELLERVRAGLAAEAG